jgi:prophage regulatory protein
VERIIRLPELVQLTGLSAASIYRLIAKGRFPRAVSLGPQAKGWKASAVALWFEGLQPAGQGHRPDAEET